MQSNIQALLDAADTTTEEQVEEALDNSPNIDLGAIVNRINDLENKVNALLKNSEEETTPEDAIEESGEGAAEEKDAMAPEQTETVEETEEVSESEEKE
jgi:hypothetical protein